MAKYEHLPIYRRSFDLAVYLEKTVHGFSRFHKYGLGLRLQHGAQDVLARVIRAQNSGSAARVKELEELRIELEVLKNLLHLAKEVRAFKSFNAYSQAAEMAVDIGRQTEGWLRSMRALQAPESRPTNLLGPPRSILRCVTGLSACALRCESSTMLRHRLRYRSLTTDRHPAPQSAEYSSEYPGGRT